ncbi:hypothetical protein MMC26_007282 [Xylographa opegraphella]|nr:hypothetical protein [Xylographa opegraphella]
MAIPQGMEIYATRLASFDIAQPTTQKKRASGVKGAKALKWPHKSPSPTDLARAGFFYAPTIACSDNVTCFVCGKELDGWEEKDDPVKEHLNFSPGCGWAINMAIEQDVEEGIREDENPMSARMLEARKSTFGDRWPHKNKRGWTCKVQKMIEAGWYHCPTAESDDFVKCAYCNLSLDGWEPKDKPFEEHQRRSPECAFFTLSQSTGVKPVRTKQGRPFKASRMSTQSNSTAALEDISMLDVAVDAAAEEGDSIATAGTYITTASTPSITARQVGTAKMGNAKARSKDMKTAVAEEITQNNSFLEAEDDDYEVKILTDSIENHRGMKRLGSDMETNDVPFEGVASTSKRRATRTRSSTNKPRIVPNQAESFKTVSDTHIVDTKDISQPTLSSSKKGGRPGRKRGSITAQKAANISTASKVSLRGVPTDTEIDAALEADLNRPLTDDDAVEVSTRVPKTRRLTRNHPHSTQLSASIACARQPAQSTTLAFEHNQVEVRVEILKVSEVDEAPSATDENLHSISTSFFEEQSMTAKTNTRKAENQAKASITPKALKQQNTLSVEQDHSIFNQPTASEFVVMAPDNNQVSKSDRENGDGPQDLASKKRLGDLPKLKQSKLRQPSQLVTGRGRAGSVVSITKPPSQSQLNEETHVLIPETVTKDILSESDTNIITEAPPKPGRKKGEASKKGETSKKVDSSSQLVEDNPPALMEKASNDHFPSFSQNVVSEEGESAAGTSIPLPFTTDFEQRPRARESSTGQPIVAQEAEEALKHKPRRGRPKGKASLSSSRLTQKQDERTPESQRISSQKLSTTTAGPVESLASSPRLVATFSPTLQPPTPKQTVLSPTPSPHSSDAENQPPSSRPSQQRPPLFETSPSMIQAKLIPLVVSTPNTSPSRQNKSCMVQTSFHWATVDIENILLGSPKPARSLSLSLSHISGDVMKDCLSSPEQKMTVEEWIQFNAKRGEEDLRVECERLVGRFEGEGNRALRTLEGVICKDS